MTALTHDAALSVDTTRADHAYAITAPGRPSA